MQTWYLHQIPAYANLPAEPAFADLLAEQVLWQARAATRRQASSLAGGGFGGLSASSEIRRSIQTSANDGF